MVLFIFSGRLSLGIQTRQPGRILFRHGRSLVLGFRLRLRLFLLYLRSRRRVGLIPWLGGRRLTAGAYGRRLPPVSAGAKGKHPKQGHFKTHPGIGRNGQVFPADKRRLIEKLRVFGAELTGQGLDLLGVTKRVIGTARNHLLHGNPMKQRQQIGKDHAVIRRKV